MSFIRVRSSRLFERPPRDILYPPLLICLAFDVLERKKQAQPSCIAVLAKVLPSLGPETAHSLPLLNKPKLSGTVLPHKTQIDGL